jgi:radical SAM protein with 4Fe4S-binding SPASM domain
MDVFDFPSHFFHRLAQAHDPAAPIQIEIQPGLHCDLYKCPHCYGFGQRSMAGEPLTVAEIDRALADVLIARPTVILSGVTTEPLTYPAAAELIRAIRGHRLPLGLYTKGRRLDESVRLALVEPGEETFITVSIDSVGHKDYLARHGVSPDSYDQLGATGNDYFDLVLDNLAQLKKERDACGSSAQIRGAFLLFENASVETVNRAVDLVGPHVDLLRFAFPQVRNDGKMPGALPAARSELLKKLAKAFEGEPKVKILISHSDPERASSFHRCWAQRFQVTIDKAGNVFPCSEVAVQPYRHLTYGNIRKQPLSDLLRSDTRRALFDLDIDRDMRCRVCNRRDEAINLTLEAYNRNFKESLSTHYPSQF